MQRYGFACSPISDGGLLIIQSYRRSIREIVLTFPVTLFDSFLALQYNFDHPITLLHVIKDCEHVIHFSFISSVFGFSALYVLHQSC